MNPRVTLAVESGIWPVPEAGTIGVFGARVGDDLAALPRDRVQVVQGFRPDFEHWERLGYDAVAEASGPFTASVVVLPRSKPGARDRIARAAALTAGPLLIDGAKTDGIDGVLKELRKRGRVGEVLSKAHGKVFAVEGADLAGWMAGPSEVAGGFMTRPGVFSADGIDRGSEALAKALPGALGRHVVDLGAGWGYLSRAVLTRAEVECVDLVEAEHAALELARVNVTDPRARFHWADAITWRPESLADTVVTNPPFHQGRTADPSLGRAFIAAAREMLTPRGSLWLVANRHLPYETELRAGFRDVSEAGGDSAFKIYHAARPISRR